MDYYNRVTMPFVDQLVSVNYKDTQDGYSLEVDDLSSIDQYQFARYLIESDRDLSSIAHNQKYDDIVSSLFQMLSKDNQDSKVDFAETVQRNIVDHYKPTMQSLINDSISWLEKADYELSGHVKKQHADNGEHYWSKSA